jgi:hypothetical protein
MATLFDTPITLNHASFQQADPPGIGLPKPLGIAWAFYEDEITASSADTVNITSIRPQGVGAYVYTLADVWASVEVFTNTASSAGSTYVTNWVNQIGTFYTQYPLFNDISNQELAGLGTTAIQRQFWGFERTLNPKRFFSGTTGPEPLGFRTVLTPARSPNHAGNYPCAIPETWAATKSPNLTIEFGVLTAALVANTLTVRAGVSYLFWAPRDRLSADANAELPVRGT